MTDRPGMSVFNYGGLRMTFLGVDDQVPSRFVLVNGLRTPGKPIRIKLAGGKFSRCKSTNARKFQVLGAKKPGKPVRRLWGTGKGRYVTSGRYASATIRGTFWLVADYCDGTLIKVRSGRVVAHDLVHKKLVVLTSGHAYFAKSS